MIKWIAILFVTFSLTSIAQTNILMNTQVGVSSQLVSNIILMSQHKVSDEVILAFIQNQKEILKPEESSKEPLIATPFNPKSYNFFYWNYLYPRTLRYRYRMLYPYRQRFPINKLDIPPH